MFTTFELFGKFSKSQSRVFYKFDEFESPAALNRPPIKYNCRRGDPPVSAAPSYEELSFGPRNLLSIQRKFRADDQNCR